MGLNFYSIWASLLRRDTKDKTGDVRQAQRWHGAAIWWEDGVPTAAASPQRAQRPRHLGHYQNKARGHQTGVLACVSDQHVWSAIRRIKQSKGTTVMSLKSAEKERKKERKKRNFFFKYEKERKKKSDKWIPTVPTLLPLRFTLQRKKK